MTTPEQTPLLVEKFLVTARSQTCGCCATAVGDTSHVTIVKVYWCKGHDAVINDLGELARDRVLQIIAQNNRLTESATYGFNQPSLDSNGMFGEPRKVEFVDRGIREVKR